MTMNLPARILVVQKDNQWSQSLQPVLRKLGFTITLCRTISEATFWITQQKFPLILMDMGKEASPEEMVFLHCARTQDPHLSIMVLRETGAQGDRALPIEWGADDCLCKPLDARELMAKLRRMQERYRVGMHQKQMPCLRFSGFTLDRQGRRLLWREQSNVRLTGREFQLLLCLIEAANEVLSRERLAVMVCGRALNDMDRSIDVMVARLRKKLKAFHGTDSLIRSVRGQGYSFGGNVEWG